jgi:hypothetical protein
MPTLTRRRYPERPDCWHVFYGDVHVGTIGIRSGVAFDEDQWGWSCGFYPGCDPGQHTNGSAPDFERARADFEEAWRRLLLTRTEQHFQEWRDGRDRHARKYKMWAAGELLPIQKPNSMMRCSCGEQFDSHDPAGSYIHRKHIYEAHSRDEIHRRATLRQPGRRGAQTG